MNREDFDATNKLLLEIVAEAAERERITLQQVGEIAAYMVALIKLATEAAKARAQNNLSNVDPGDIVH
jgi:hypothetical protein